MKKEIKIKEEKEDEEKEGKKVFNEVKRVFNVGEVKRKEKEIEKIKKENYKI